jgi:septum site-determining protein MinC
MKKNELGLHSIEKAFNRKIDETKSKIYDGSLRSGNKIEYNGTVIVIGDINAGAEVIAEENIIVLGTIRGLAHAGAKGNKSAMIIGNLIMAPQLRIADKVKEIEKNETDELKKRAYIQEDEIILE